MLPRWVAHYGRECGTDHLYVIDDNTSDGSTDDLPCSVIRIPSWGDKHFEATLRDADREPDRRGPA